MEIPIERLGYPGALTELHVVPQFPGQGPGDTDRLADVNERDFEVAALLSKAPSPITTLNFNFDELDGNSYFKFEYPGMSVETQWGAVSIGKNSQGEASIARMTCRSRSYVEALERLQLACGSFLDHWAFASKAPVYITQLRARDIVNEVTMMRFISPFQIATINPSNIEIPTPLRPILALYREALGSASPVYKFLCFYKILEGYFTRLKPNLAKLFKEKGLSYPLHPDIVPEHPDLDDTFREYVGRSMTQFRDELLTPEFRNAVAHFEKDGLSPLVMSNPNEIIRFNNSSLAVELCARQVIESYCAAFSTAKSAGIDLSTLAES